MVSEASAREGGRAREGLGSFPSYNSRAVLHHFPASKASLHTAKRCVGGHMTSV